MYFEIYEYSGIHKKVCIRWKTNFLWLFHLSIVSLLMYHAVDYRQNLNPVNQLLLVVIIIIIIITGGNSQALKIFNKVKGFNCLLI